MLHDFEFNNIKLSELGAVIIEKPSYVFSMKELDFTSIPNKSGDVITDKNRFKNVGLSYKISSVPTFCDYNEQQFVYKLSEWLLTSYDYKVLRDTYNPGYFRKAVCTSISDSIVEAGGVVTATITFTCDPFLYSDRGLSKIVYKSAGEITGNVDETLVNPEKWGSEPIVKITGNGSFSCVIGDASFTVENVDESITIDKPNEIVFDKDGKPCNDKISALRLPTLKSGSNTVLIVSVGDADFSIEITPNWRRL